MKIMKKKPLSGNLLLSCEHGSFSCAAAVRIYECPRETKTKQNMIGWSLQNFTQPAELLPSKTLHTSLSIHWGIWLNYNWFSCCTIHRQWLIIEVDLNSTTDNYYKAKMFISFAHMIIDMFIFSCFIMLTGY